MDVVVGVARVGRVWWGEPKARFGWGGRWGCGVGVRMAGGDGDEWSWWLRRGRGRGRGG